MLTCNKEPLYIEIRRIKFGLYSNSNKLFNRKNETNEAIKDKLYINFWKELSGRKWVLQIQIATLNPDQEMNVIIHKQK